MWLAQHIGGRANSSGRCPVLLSSLLRTRLVCKNSACPRPANQAARPVRDYLQEQRSSAAASQVVQWAYGTLSVCLSSGYRVLAAHLPISTEYIVYGCMQAWKLSSFSLVGTIHPQLPLLLPMLVPFRTKNYPTTHLPVKRKV
ncbi:hypothetical protein IF1G_07691 [Cordyceps javanica]|uniref:Uncharacterized protein n=1 Tax=Cordyceps javanica TaxID=43265 RepID=A0A545UWX1_9HYPO|nr:hypothetical protein IF1G_07691 [Cordyceps javanica]